MTPKSLNEVGWGVLVDLSTQRRNHIFFTMLSSMTGSLRITHGDAFGLFPRLHRVPFGRPIVRLFIAFMLYGLRIGGTDHRSPITDPLSNLSST